MRDPKIAGSNPVCAAEIVAVELPPMPDLALAPIELRRPPNVIYASMRRCLVFARRGDLRIPALSADDVTALTAGLQQAGSERRLSRWPAQGGGARWIFLKRKRRKQRRRRP